MTPSYLRQVDDLIEFFNVEKEKLQNNLSIEAEGFRPLLSGFWVFLGIVYGYILATPSLDNTTHAIYLTIVTLGVFLGFLVYRYTPKLLTKNYGDPQQVYGVLSFLHSLKFLILEPNLEPLLETVRTRLSNTNRAWLEDVAKSVAEINDEINSKGKKG